MEGNRDRFALDPPPVALDPRLWVCEGVRDCVEAAALLHLAVMKQSGRPDKQAEGAFDLYDLPATEVWEERLSHEALVCAFVDPHVPVVVLGHEAVGVAAGGGVEGAGFPAPAGKDVPVASLGLVQIVEPVGDCEAVKVGVVGAECDSHGVFSIFWG